MSSNSLFLAWKTSCTRNLMVIPGTIIIVQLSRVPKWVFLDLCRCHTKRRMERVCRLLRLYCKVNLIQKEGLAGLACWCFFLYGSYKILKDRFCGTRLIVEMHDHIFFYLTGCYWSSAFLLSALSVLFTAMSYSLYTSEWFLHSTRCNTREDSYTDCGRPQGRQTLQ